MTMAASNGSRLSIIERLPFELQSDIFDLLNYQDAIRLAQVTHYFHNVIIPQDWPVADKEAFVFRLQFEDKYHKVWGLYSAFKGELFRVNADGYACFSCYKVKRAEAFSWAQTDLAKDGSGADRLPQNNRVCLECGISQGIYQPGICIKIAVQVRQCDFKILDIVTKAADGMICAKCKMPSECSYVFPPPTCAVCVDKHNLPSVDPFTVRPYTRKSRHRDYDFSKKRIQIISVMVRCVHCDHEQSIKKNIKRCCHCDIQMCPGCFKRINNDRWSSVTWCGAECADAASHRWRSQRMKKNEEAQTSEFPRKLPACERGRDLFQGEEDYLLGSMLECEND